LLSRLSIRLFPPATLESLQDSFRCQREMEWVGQTVRRRRNIFVIYVVSKDARPVNLFWRRLVEAELADAVTAQRLDV
jgi:hypothetical protein